MESRPPGLGHRAGRGHNPTCLCALCPGPSVPFAEDPKWNVIEFETTPVMSTYLLAYIVCEFTSVKTVAPNNVQVWS